MPLATVRVLMGSKSDWETMQHAVATLEELGIACDARALSAHRTPHAVDEYVRQAEADGAQVFIAAAGGAAHLAGVIAARTQLPVLGVPMESKLIGLDSLLSIAQMPAGIPVGTLAVGKAGAINAALLAAAILALSSAPIAEALRGFRARQTQKALRDSDVRAARPAS